MFRFEHPEFLWLATLAPVLLILYVLRRYLLSKDWKAWNGQPNVGQANHFLVRPRHLWLGLPAVLLLAVASANPQWGYRTVTVENQSADLYILLDISNSMLAEDVAPNRLDRAKQLAIELVERFSQDRIGLIVFAGHAYMQSPLTTDKHAIQLFINAASPDQAGTQGTAIGEGLRLLMKPKTQEQASGGAIIIFTDGEDHDSEAQSLAEEAAKAGWVTYVLGIGTTEGATIPMRYDGNSDVKRDQNGQPVITALNGELMAELATAGQGKYFEVASEKDVIQSLAEELEGLERTQNARRSFSEYNSYYQWFLLPALLLLCLLTLLNPKFEVI